MSCVVPPLVPSPTRQERRESLSYAKEDLSDLEQQCDQKRRQLDKALKERASSAAGGAAPAQGEQNSRTSPFF